MTQVGTKRYMAPELLDATMATGSFEAYKQQDVYAFSLVLWEVARVCGVDGGAAGGDEYRVPYYDCVDADPSFDEMRKVVCDDQRRPIIPARFRSDEVSQYACVASELCSALHVSECKIS